MKKKNTIPVTALHLNERNPRTITKDAFMRLRKSIERDPKFMELRPIVTDEKGTILGGNQRYRACIANGMTELPAAWVRQAADLTPAERKRFVILDNSPDGISGEWDDGILAADYELEELSELGYVDFDVAETKAPELKDGDRAPFRQATFILHDEQWEEVEAALSKAKKYGGGESAVNENSNGNALAWICGRFNRG